jgi:pyruvate kinase
MRRHRKIKIVATLGPASSTKEMIRALHEAGADVFRLNMSHGSHEDVAARHRIIREVEAEGGQPIAILADLQGPKLRVGTFGGEGAFELEAGQAFRLDLDPAPGDATRVQLPHKEIFDALEPGSSLLVNDGKIRLKVVECGRDFANCTVTVGGTISNRKGVNVPDVVLPLAALSEKDRRDLEFVCELGVDWLALSFVQRAADVEEARGLAEGTRRDPVEDREARGGAGLRRHPSRVGRHHGGAGRPGGGAARAERAAHPEAAGAKVPRRGEARDRGDPDARA